MLKKGKEEQVLAYIFHIQRMFYRLKEYIFKKIYFSLIHKQKIFK